MTAPASPCAEAIAARLLVEKLRAENSALVKDRDELKTAIEIYRIGCNAEIAGGGTVRDLLKSIKYGCPGLQIEYISAIDHVLMDSKKPPDLGG